MKKIENNSQIINQKEEIFYSEDSANKLKKQSSQKQQSIKQFLNHLETPSKGNILKQWNSKSQKKVRKKYIKANIKKEHSAVQQKPARNKSQSIAKLSNYSFKKIVLKKIHKKNHQFFNVREDYFLLISEYIFAFPEFGFKNLTSLLRVIADVTNRTLKSVQRRREKLKKLSRLQIWVLENYFIRFLTRMNNRKILNLKYENINIIKIDNTDIPEIEKDFIKNLIKDYEKVDLSPNILEKIPRTRGRPQSENTLNLQEQCAELDLYELYNPWIIEDLKKFLFKQKKHFQQIKLTDNFLQGSYLKKKDFSSSFKRSIISQTPIINKDISIMSLLTNSACNSIKLNKEKPQNCSIKKFFPSLKVVDNEDEVELKNINLKLIDDIIEEEKSEIEKSKLSNDLFGSKKQLILCYRKRDYKRQQNQDVIFQDYKYYNLNNASILHWSISFNSLVKRMYLQTIQICFILLKESYQFI